MDATLHSGLLAHLYNRCKLLFSTPVCVSGFGTRTDMVAALESHRPLAFAAFAASSVSVPVPYASMPGPPSCFTLIPIAPHLCPISAFASIAVNGVTSPLPPG